MSLLNLLLALEPKVTIESGPVGATTYSNPEVNGQRSNIATITTAGPHNLKFDPPAGHAPTYFVSFTGPSPLANQIFRILSIPTATTFQIYCSVPEMVLTSTQVVPVFYPPFGGMGGSNWLNGPTQFVPGTTPVQMRQYPPAAVQAATVFCVLGENCTMRIDQTQRAQILDAMTPITPTTAPEWTDFLKPEENGYVVMSPAWAAIFATGSAGGTTTLSAVS
jgi:hypothetical protein